jgi:hypothetical protein
MNGQDVTAGAGLAGASGTAGQGAEPETAHEEDEG